MNKKGGVLGWFLSIMPDLMITIILFILLLLILSPFLMKVISPDTGNQAAKTSFDYLTSEFELLLDSPKDFENKNVIYRIPPGYYLVGFDGNSEYVNVLDNNWGTEFIRGSNTSLLYKPDVCIGQACACLYNKLPKLDDEDDKEKHLVKCRLFSPNVRFLGYLGDLPMTMQGKKTVVFPEEDTRFESLYFGAPMFSGEGEEFNTVLGGGEFYIEKIVNGEQAYLLMTPLAKELENHISAFERCPQNSPDQTCKGKPYGWVYHNESEGKYFACVYSDSEQRCALKSLQGECEENVYIGTACKCGDEVAYPGDICIQEEIFDDVDCEEFVSCSDYCKNSYCVGEEETLCQGDPCSLGCNFVEEFKFGKICIS